MIDLSPEVVTLLLLGGVLFGVLVGYPLGFVLGGLALIVGYLCFGTSVIGIIYSKIAGHVINYVFLAVPMFIFMGVMLARSGIVARLYDSLYVWFGGLRGGLSVTTVAVGTILAACVGNISGSISMLTLVALPQMIRHGYDKSLATATICAGGSLGILIPPSIMLVVYGPMAGLSVGKLFFGAFGAGFLLSGLYIGYILIRCFFQPHIAPAVPPEARRISFIGKTIPVLTSLVPVALLIGAVLGVIFVGIAPPTEAAALGAFTTIFLAVAYRGFSLKMLYETALRTFRISGFIFLIIITAVAFTAVFIRAGCSDVVLKAVTGAPGGRWGAFAVMMAIVFLLGFLMDWIGIVFILVPIMTPIAQTLGFEPIWFAIMVCVTLQTNFMTPPFAPAIFWLRGAAPPELGVTFEIVVRGVIPFVILILIGAALLVVFPQIITWLPTQMLAGGW